MIFIYNYFKVPDVPKDLEPLSEYIKKYNKVLVADIDTFAVFIDEVYKKFNSIPNANKNIRSIFLIVLSLFTTIKLYSR